MSEPTIGRLTLLCCLLLLGSVAWSGLQIRDLSQQWQTTNERRRIDPMTLTTKDVVNTASGTKADITTTKTVDETDAQWVARHLAAIAAWKNATTG